MRRQDLAVTLPWVEQGTTVLLDAASHADLAAPSFLPGWTGADVVAHVACNADALGRLLVWGRTGVVTPMYASAQARDEEIAAVSDLPHDALRTRMATSAVRLADSLAAIDGPVWEARVRSARGRELPVREVPWMRTREVWLHALDLAEDLSLQDLPETLRDELFDDVVDSYVERAATPKVELSCSGRTLTLGTDGLPQQVSGDRDEVLQWLTGRRAHPTPRPSVGPPMPPWL